jgi:hypothetical protein
LFERKETPALSHSITNSGENFLLVFDAPPFRNAVSGIFSGNLTGSKANSRNFPQGWRRRQSSLIYGRNIARL